MGWEDDWRAWHQSGRDAVRQNLTPPWTDEEIADLIAAPYDYERHGGKYPWRSAEAFSVKRKRLGITRVSSGGTPPPSERGVSWDDFLRPVSEMQRLRDKLRPGHHREEFTLPPNTPLAFVSDFHIGSWGTDHFLLRDVTEVLRELHKRKGLRIVVLGDMLQMAIKLRGWGNIKEVKDDLFPPGMQHDLLEFWLSLMAPMLLWAVWDNHAIQREEDAAGDSYTARLFRHVTTYYSGIAHSDLLVGDQRYTVATSHKFRGRSRTNPLASQMNYIRYEAHDREVVVAGDSHVPALMQYPEGGMWRTVANCGSLQTESGYAQRYFTLNSYTQMPVLVFHGDVHLVSPFASIEQYERVLG